MTVYFHPEKPQVSEFVKERCSWPLFRFELLTNLLREGPERIVVPQLLQGIVFRWIGEVFSFERVCAANEGLLQMGSSSSRITRFRVRAA